MTDPPRPRRSSGVLAMLAVIGVVLIWWLFSGNGPQGPSGNDPGLLAPDVDASGDTSPSAVPLAGANALRLTSYVEQAEGLQLRLTVPAGECPELLTPRVIESDVAVTVTVLHAENDGCQVAGRDLPATLTVALDSPLADRAVLDGALVQRTRVEPAG